MAKYNRDNGKRWTRREWLITEQLSVFDYHALVESTTQLIFDVYGDPSKGPLRREDYYVLPPEYLDEDALRGRKSITEAILRGIPPEQIETVKQWMRSVRLFLTEREATLGDWKGWQSVINTSAAEHAHL
jgi:hypothetical protein